MIATTQLAARLVRRHRDLYVGVMVMIALTMLRCHWRLPSPTPSKSTCQR